MSAKSEEAVRKDASTVLARLTEEIPHHEDRVVLVNACGVQLFANGPTLDFDGASV